MARIHLEGLRHSYLAAARDAVDTDWALRGLDLAWNDGGAYALLGPSGCGKTTLAQPHLGPAAARRAGASASTGRM
jgi:glycerol transport system ATP-binding protein